MLICFKCGKIIEPNDNRYFVTFKKRNIEVKKSWYLNAYSLRIIKTYCGKCYKDE